MRCLTGLLLAGLLLLIGAPVDAQQSFFSYFRSLPVLNTLSSNDRIVVCQNACEAGNGMSLMPVSQLGVHAAANFPINPDGLGLLSPTALSSDHQPFVDFISNLPLTSAATAQDQTLVCANPCDPSTGLKRMSLNNLFVANMATAQIDGHSGSFLDYFRSLPVATTNTLQDQILVFSAGQLWRVPLSALDGAVPPDPGPGGDAVRVYYATNGNGSNPGTEQQPLATPQQAKARVEQLLAQNRNQDIAVIGRGGVYRFSQGMTFGPADSPNNGYKVWWMSAPNEVAEWSGSQRVTGTWTQGTCSSEYGSVTCFHIPLPGAKFTELYVNYVHRQMSREPPALWQRWPITLPQDPVNGPWSGSNVGISIGARENPPQPTWRNITDIEVQATHSWAASWCQLSAIEPTVIRLDPDCFRSLDQNFFRLGYGGAWGHNLSWLQNAYEFLPGCDGGAGPNGEGCWYWDRAGQTLYYVPYHGEDITSEDVEVPRTEVLATIDNGRNLEFNRLAIEGTEWVNPTQNGFVSTGGSSFCKTPAAVGLLNCLERATAFSGLYIKDRSRNITVSHSLFRNNAGVSIYLDGGWDIDIYANKFVENAAGGCYRGGGAADAAPEDEVRNLDVSDNLCQGGFRDLSSRGFSTGYVANMRWAHNRFDNMPQAAMTMGGALPFSPDRTFSGNFAIEANFFNQTCLQLPMYDCGAIWTFGPQWPGAVISDNYSIGRGQAPEGGLQMQQEFMMGCFYADDNSENYIWENNVCEESRFFHSFTHWVMINVVLRNNFATNAWVTAPPGGMGTFQDDHCTRVCNQNLVGFSATNRPTAVNTVIANAGIEPGVTPGPTPPPARPTVSGWEPTAKAGDVYLSKINYANDTASVDTTGGSGWRSVRGSKGYATGSGEKRYFTLKIRDSRFSGWLGGLATSALNLNNSFGPAGIAWRATTYDTPNNTDHGGTVVNIPLTCGDSPSAYPGQTMWVAVDMTQNRAQCSLNCRDVTSKTSFTLPTGTYYPAWSGGLNQRLNSAIIDTYPDASGCSDLAGFQPWG